MSENGELQRIHDKWLSTGPSPATTADLQQDPDRLHVQSFSALFLISGAACVAALAIHACVLARQYSRHVAAEQAALSGGGVGPPATVLPSPAPAAVAASGRSCPSLPQL